MTKARQSAEETLQAGKRAHIKRFTPTAVDKLRYLARITPSYAWQRITRRPFPGQVHLIFSLADHFEPAIVPSDRRGRAPSDEQQRRLENWCREYPQLAGEWRDSDGCPFQHTYFYPAEQYNAPLIDRLAEHCHAGWGEAEIHLHHGVDGHDTAENTARVISEFRDELKKRGCLAYLDGNGMPRYAFVHGNFALANSARGRACGVDSEMRVLAETGCYADMTLPTGTFHWSQTAKINALYECAAPLHLRAPQRKGHDLRVGHEPKIFPLIIQGPLVFKSGGKRGFGIENGSLVGTNPPSLGRLQLWKQAAITVKGRPDWLFIKLHCHSMDPTHRDALLGNGMKTFLRELTTGAAERREILHFTSAREMVNIVLAACDGREGSPGEYRDYRLKRVSQYRGCESKTTNAEMVMKG